jgi:hypothetical protein
MQHDTQASAAVTAAAVVMFLGIIWLWMAILS